MADTVIDSEIRHRQLSVEETTTKLIYQRQGFVLYMPKVHKKQLGLDVEFPHKFNAQIVDNLEEIGSIKFDVADVEAITENIRRLHYLAVTKYDDIDPELVPKPYQNDSSQPPKPPVPSHYAPSAPYDKIPLRHDASEFRVLEVVSGTRGSPMKCHLFNASSPREVDYEALSYVWGVDPPGTGPRISVNDCSICVTENLYAALDSLRLSERNRLLWVDAICIDQSNQKEKVTQLPMMGEIYREATRVCVYLGAADEESDYLLRVLKEHQDLEAPLGTKIQNTPHWATTLEYLKANDSRIRRSILSLITRPWFSRMWVYQEFHLATCQPRIYIGSHSVSASVMFGSLFALLMLVSGSTETQTKQVTRNLEHLLHDEEDAIAATGSSGIFSKLKRKALMCHYAVHANDLMPRYPSFWLADPAVAAAKCGNPRDNIFGISGMFDPIAREILVTDYDMPIEDVFMRTTAWCLMVDNVVLYTFLRYPLLPAGKYPSWVLDFEHSIPYDTIEESTKIKEEQIFPDQDPLARNCIVHQQMLFIDGVEFTTIDSVSVSPAEDEHAKLNRLWHFEQELAISEKTNTLSDGAIATENPVSPILEWAAGFPRNSTAFLIPNSPLYTLILTKQFPHFPETEAYPSSAAMPELLGGLVFDTDRLVREFQEACQTNLAGSTGQKVASSTTLLRYARLHKTLLGADLAENARVMRVLNDFIQNLVPTVFNEDKSELYLNQHGFSSTDAHQNTKTIVAAIEAEGDKIDENIALGLAMERTFDYANRRDEYAQRLLNCSFFTTTNGVPGLGSQGAHGFQKGDKIVFFRKMPTAIAIRRCEDDDWGAYRFVGIVQLKGLIDGSIYERPEIKEGKPELFVIR